VPIPKLSLIHWTALVGAALLGAALGGLGLALIDALGGHRPTPGWLVVAGLGLGGLAAGLGAWFAHQRFHRRRRYPDPARGLALVALARACALAGAGLAGLYLALAGADLPHWAVEAARQQAGRSFAVVVAALVLMAGGKLLERECRIDHGDRRPSPDDDFEPGKEGRRR
jgi:hypothetical protein